MRIPTKSTFGLLTPDEGWTKGMKTACSCSVDVPDLFSYGWKRWHSAFALQLLSHVYREEGPLKCLYIFFSKVLLKRYSCRKVCRKNTRTCCLLQTQTRVALPLCAPMQAPNARSRIKAGAALICPHSLSSSPHLSCVFSSPNPLKQKELPIFLASGNVHKAPAARKPVRGFHGFALTLNQAVNGPEVAVSPGWS